jgi:Uncharacterized protein conserved in bacteria (DUF2188)
MKSSTARKTKKNETARLITNKELRKLTLQVYLFRQGWVVVDDNDDEVKSTHRTQAKAAEKGRALAKKRGGRLLVRGRNGLIRKREYYWSGPVRFEPLRSLPPSVPPINATRKAISKAVKEVIRIMNAEAAQQNK